MEMCATMECDGGDEHFCFTMTEYCYAILVKKIRWSESSLIVTWVTDKFGTLQTSVRGALQPKSSFAGKLDIFHHAEISFDSARSGSLHSLREVTLISTLEISSYRRLEMASYFAELSATVTPAMHPAPEIHSLLNRALNYLRDNDPDERILPHFEREMAKLLGIWDPSEKVSPSVAIAGLCGGYLPRSRPRL